LLLSSHLYRENPNLLSYTAIRAFKLYNIGNSNPENLLDFVQILQEELVRAGGLPALRKGLRAFAEWYFKFYRR